MQSILMSRYMGAGLTARLTADGLGLRLTVCWLTATANGLAVSYRPSCPCARTRASVKPAERVESIVQLSEIVHRRRPGATQLRTVTAIAAAQVPFARPTKQQFCQATDSAPDRR